MIPFIEMGKCSRHFSLYSTYQNIIHFNLSLLLSHWESVIVKVILVFHNFLQSEIIGTETFRYQMVSK